VEPAFARRRQSVQDSGDEDPGAVSDEGFYQVFVLGAGSDYKNARIVDEIGDLQYS